MSSTTTKARPAAGSAAAKASGADTAGDEQPAGGRRKKLLVVLLVVVVAAAAAWFFLLRGGGGEETKPEPVPGEVVALDPISVNLANGRYLRVGIALQVIEGPAHAPDGSQALDIVISTLSGQDAAALADPAHREALKEELKHKVEEAYHHDVMDVYFTEFVTQ